MNETTIAILGILGSAACSFVIAWKTSRWQIRLHDKENASDRRFALYDEITRLITDLEGNPALSFDDDYLKRFRYLAGNIKVYAPKGVVSAVSEFVELLEANRRAYAKACDALRDQWCESEHVVSEDGYYSSQDYRLVAGEPWEYKEAAEQLRIKSMLSSDAIRAASEKVIVAMRNDASLDWGKR